jgi:hypothetical protein
MVDGALVAIGVSYSDGDLVLLNVPLNKVGEYVTLYVWLKGVGAPVAPPSYSDLMVGESVLPTWWPSVLLNIVGVMVLLDSVGDNVALPVLFIEGLMVALPVLFIEGLMVLLKSVGAIVTLPVVFVPLPAKEGAEVMAIDGDVVEFRPLPRFLDSSVRDGVSDVACLNIPSANDSPVEVVTPAIRRQPAIAAKPRRTIPLASVPDRLGPALGICDSDIDMVEGD